MTVRGTPFLTNCCHGQYFSGGMILHQCSFHIPHSSGSFHQKQKTRLTFFSVEAQKKWSKFVIEQQHQYSAQMLSSVSKVFVTRGHIINSQVSLRFWFQLLCFWILWHINSNTRNSESISMHWKSSLAGFYLESFLSVCTFHKEMVSAHTELWLQRPNEASNRNTHHMFRV